MSLSEEAWTADESKDPVLLDPKEFRQAGVLRLRRQLRGRLRFRMTRGSTRASYAAQNDLFVEIQHRDDGQRMQPTKKRAGIAAALRISLLDDATQCMSYRPSPVCATMVTLSTWIPPSLLIVPATCT